MAIAVLSVEAVVETMQRKPDLGMILLAGTALALGSLRVTHASDQDDAGRGVARISVMDGQVSVKRGDSGDWVAGIINAPLMTGDHISTAPNSRAEVEFDAGNVLRIGGNAEVNLAVLDNGHYQINIAHGTVTYVILRPSQANAELDTPSLSVRPSGQGAYRIAVNEGGQSQVTARSGQAEIFTPEGSEQLNAGQTLETRGSPSNPEFQVVTAIPMDEWDGWNQQRDQTLTHARSDQYVPQGVYGAEDLDQYGTWNNVAPYGPVWTPTVAAGWAPYRAGRWVWLDWYGWTWVSYDPWGWAPYHYGRWFFDAGLGWSWYPGVVGVRHYWSPALVAFFGYGSGGGFGFGFGNIGWVPLAPYEVFHPWWGREFTGRGSNDRITFTNVNVYNGYRNARFNGVSGIGVNEFHNGRFGAVSRVSADQVRTAGLVRGRMSIAPSAAHYQFANRTASFIPRSTGNTRFFTPQQSGRGFGRGFGSARATYQQSPGAMRSPQMPGGSWRRFGEPSGQGPGAAANPRGWNSSPANQNTRPQASNNGGWGSFGEPRSNNRGGSAGPRYSAPAAPPVARERSAFPGYGGGGPGYSAPRNNAPSGPRYSAPRYSAPPRSSGGGGGARFGGGQRGGGGGGHRR